MAGYFNAGQDCTAATRVIAGPKVYDDFVAALAEQARGTKTGMPDDEDVLYGPLNNASQLQRVGDMVSRHARARRGGHGRRHGRPATGSSTTRRWSPGSSSTTR